MSETFYATKQVIYATDEPGPYLGYDAVVAKEYNTDTNVTTERNPWSWDFMHWPDYDAIDNFRIVYGEVPIGIPEDYFQSGIGSGDDCKIENIFKKLVNFNREWRARLLYGTFFLQDKEFFLYPDESIVHYLDSSENENVYSTDYVNVLQLAEDIRTGIPITASTFMRDKTTHKISVYRKFNEMYEFTSSNGSRTRSAIGEIMWENVDPYVMEFVVDRSGTYPKLYFASDFLEKPVGASAITSADDLYLVEYVSSKIPDVYEYETKLFPLDDGQDIDIWTLDTGGTLRTWTVLNINDTTPYAAYTCKVDPETGTIFFGTACTFNLGDVLYINYAPSVKVEYAPDWAKDYYTGDRDINPMVRGVERGLVVLNSYGYTEPASIKLTTNAPYVPAGNYYGPLYSIGESASLVATVKDSDDNPLPGAQVHFQFSIPPYSGLIDGGTTSNKITNQNGQCFALYQAPTKGEDMMQYTTTVTDSGGDKLVSLLNPITDDLTKVYIYGHYKFWNETDIEFFLEPSPWNRRILIYEQKTPADSPTPINPWSGLPDTLWVPARPTALSADGLTLTYDTLPSIGDLLDGIALEGFYVGAEQEVTVIAYVEDAATGAKLYSNTLTFKLSLPDSQLGEIYIPESAPQYRVPYGWRLLGGDETEVSGLVASALNGLTFLTINPPGSYPVAIWDLISDENDQGIPAGIEYGGENAYNWYGYGGLFGYQYDYV